MTFTMQSVADLARLDINDVEKTRNPDANMIKFANDAIARIYVVRPDLNWGNYQTGYTDVALTDVFPLPIEYRRPVADFMVMCCETSDDPFAVEQRAIQALALYMKGLGMG